MHHNIFIFCHYQWNKNGYNSSSERATTSCPLSSYLFLMCGKALSNLLSRAERNGLIHGMKFSNDVNISHLFFVDDSLIFTKASIEDCHHLKRIFYCYAAASGQLFKYDKSSMFFNGNINSRLISVIKNIF